MSDDKPYRRASIPMLPACSATQAGERKYEETYGDYAQRSRMAARARLRLVMDEFGAQMHQSAHRGRQMARSAVRELSAQAGLLASRKLFKLAQRIERKAEAIRQS